MASSIPVEKANRKVEHFERNALHQARFDIVTSYYLEEGVLHGMNKKVDSEGTSEFSLGLSNIKTDRGAIGDLLLENEIRHTDEATRELLTASCLLAAALK